MQRNPTLSRIRLFLAWLLASVISSICPQLVRAQNTGCPIFPTDSVWNTPVDTLPVHPSSDTYVTAIGKTIGLHPDFGTVYQGTPNGIPFTIVPSTQPFVPVVYTAYGNESDPGPFPIPPNALIEGGANSTGDRHVLVIQTGICKLYELFNAHPVSGGSWTADSGAVWNLHSHALRLDSWTSADAAGLPIFPGLVRYDEVQAGAITHALRFTVPKTQSAHLWPARHHTAPTGAQYPPMGLRFRLKASYDISSFSPKNQVILRAMKKYGMFVSDNGSAWYISGAPDTRWDDDDLHALGRVTGANFEAVDESGLRIIADSGQARQGTGTPACTQIPDPPVLLTPPAEAVVTVGPVLLDWADVSCATSYRVLIRRGPRRKATVYQRDRLLISQDVIPLLARGTYYWSVSVCNNYGCSSSMSRPFTVQ